MISPTKFTNYLDLLKIRQKARKRDTIIMGMVFWISFLATIGFGLVTVPGGRELYLVVPINFVLGISYVIVSVKLEITNETIELMNNLRS